ncbi:MAG TPA: ribosome silencing factor [Candidatus Polarisedimenticolia bacterium]|nr:ribosome silencing factor [Candidatus Polarisedimenticolia bacterium]
MLEAAAEKKAENPVALDLRKVAAFTDGFVICTGAQRRQTQAIADEIVERLRAAGEKASHIEGYERGEWILLDLSDVIVHVFTPETRSFYGLERLWGDTPRIAPTDGARRRAPAKPRPRRVARRA